MIVSAARSAAAAIPLGGVGIVAAQQSRGIGEGRDRQAVPGRERLVVAGGLRPGRPPGQELGARRRQSGLERGVLARRRRRVDLRPDPRQDRPRLPVALVGDAVGRHERLGIVAEDLADLGGRPDERQPLDAFGVGVLAGGEGAVGRRELADHVVEGSRRDVAVAGLAGRRPGVEVDPRELGVVVEHLLEVRHEPDRVGRVAVEAAAELVVDPAVGHLVEREPHDGVEPGVAAAPDGAAGTRWSSAGGTSARRPSCRCAHRTTA